MVPAVHAACPAWYRARTLHPARHLRTARYGLHAKPCGKRTHPGGARERLSLTEPPDLDSTRARHHKSSSSTGTQYRGAASARGVSTGIIDSRCIGRECVKPPCGLSNKGWISSEPPARQTLRHTTDDDEHEYRNKPRQPQYSLPRWMNAFRKQLRVGGLLGAARWLVWFRRSHGKCSALRSHGDQLAVSAPSLAS